MSKFNSAMKDYYKIILAFSIAASFAFLILAFHEGHFSLSSMIIKMFRGPELFVLTIGTIGATISTYMIQITTRNKIADIGIIGVSSINYLAFVLLYSFMSVEGYVAFGSYISPVIYTACSFGLLILIYLLTFRYKRASNKIIIVGIVLTLTISAISTMVMMWLPDHKQQYITLVSMGRLDVASRTFLRPEHYISIGLIVFSVILLGIFWKKIKIVYTDEIKAQVLGINIKLVRIVNLFIAAACAAAGFIEMGNVLFVGFVATNIGYTFMKRMSINQLIFIILIALCLMYIVYSINVSFTTLGISLGIITNIIAIPYFLATLIMGGINGKRIKNK